jgi:redox-sensitive bicupin YhaK (pirin superfamily)
MILSKIPLGFPWPCADPFLFCVYHLDHFPPGNDAMGPAVPLSGRQIGQDFANIDGWNMYHGETVPGFPQHPHRGFETVTVVRRGLVDHSDSLGATARYGEGDTQWLTTGRGISHTEMFPLVNKDGGNPTELFQIWLNLPPAKKMSEPRFSMLWAPSIPRLSAPGAEIVIVAGQTAGLKAPAPPPDSWATHPGSEVAIWTIKLEAGASWILPAAAAGLNRALYFFKGKSISLGAETLSSHQRLMLKSDEAAEIKNGGEAAELLLLQGRPIGAPVASYGPFVMNSQAELQKTIEEYQATRFGGWPWPTSDPVHPRDSGRFARFPDGRVEKPA